MAQEPKKRHSKARKRTRRAAIILEQVALSVCKNCGQPVQSHIVCRSCGYYKGKAVTSKKVQVTRV